VTPRILLAALAALVLSGCTSTGQSFHELHYSVPDEKGDQFVTDETIVKNRTFAPPFGSKADATHNFSAGVDQDGNWTLVMGSAGKLEGGELAQFIQALTGLTAEIGKLIASLQGVPIGGLPIVAPP
jgi:hypothetical protein